MVSDELKMQMVEERDALARAHSADKLDVSFRHTDEWKAQRTRHNKDAEAMKEQAKGENLHLQAKHLAEWAKLKESQRATRNMLKKRHADLRAKEEGT